MNAAHFAPPCNLDQKEKETDQSSMGEVVVKGEEVVVKEEEMTGGKGPVVVTGASGFVGSWLVMKLLQAGYTVRATVRDPCESLLNCTNSELSLSPLELCTDRLSRNSI